MQFIIPGKPIEKKRARFTAASGFPRAYSIQHKDENLVRSIITETLPKNFKPIEGPLLLIIGFLMPLPKSYSKKKKDSIVGLFHNKKPDLTNLIKFYEDALNGVLYADDSQIVKIDAYKRWSDEPKTCIQLVSL